MKRAIHTIIAITIPVLLSFTYAHGAGIPSINDTPEAFISQPPFIPATNFSTNTYQLTVSGNYGYEKYRIKFLSSFHLHRAGIQLAASGALTDALGWNVAIGFACPGTVSKYVSMRLGSCMIPFSASVAWRFIGAPDRSNCAIFAGVSYIYSAMRGYYRRYVPGDPYYFYVAKTVALADILGSVYGLFAGIRPSVHVTNNVAILPFAAYRVTFDTSGFYYHVRLKVLNDEPEKSGPLAFKYRQSQDPQRPIHEILIGLELSMYGVGIHAMLQYSPVSSRTMCGLVLSYTYSFAVKKMNDQRI